MIYIFWACHSLPEAKIIVRRLLDQGLIGCGSIFPEVESIYRWKGKVVEGREVKVILKTTEDHFDAIQKYILQHGSYEVPEILQVDIAQGNPHYLSWISQNVTTPHPRYQKNPD